MLIWVKSIASATAQACGRARERMRLERGLGGAMTIDVVGRFALAGLIASALWAGATAASAADAKAGKQIFQRRCSGCHSDTPGGTALGPNLVGIIGRKAGSGQSGVHSRALYESDLTWTESSLRKYLASPSTQV